MPSSYPGGLDAFTNPVAGDTLDSPPHDVQHADVNDAVEAIEAELGTDPSGTFPTVRDRVEGVEAALSGLVLDDITDVAAPAPVDGQVLTWDTGTALWRPETPTGGGGIEPVAPSEIASLAAHYDAQSIVGLANGDPVGQWDDLSGAGRHLTSSGSLRPLYATSSIGGHPAVVFDGSDDLMEAPWSGASGTDQPWSGLLVCRVGAAASGDRVAVSISRSAVDANPIHHIYWNVRYGASRRQDGGGGTANLTGGVWPKETDTIIVWSFDGIRMHLWVNGTVELLVDQDVGNLTVDRIVVGSVRGAWAAGSLWLGPIGEVAVFGGTLTGTQRRGLEQYASARWGIAV